MNGTKLVIYFITIVSCFSFHCVFIDLAPGALGNHGALTIFSTFAFRSQVLRSSILALGLWPIYCIVCGAAMHQRLSTQAKTPFLWQLDHLPASCMASSAKPILASSAANWAFSQEPSCHNIHNVAASIQKHAETLGRENISSTSPPGMLKVNKGPWAKKATRKRSTAK